jgi:hypothetical protein
VTLRIRFPFNDQRASGDVPDTNVSLLPGDSGFIPARQGARPALTTIASMSKFILPLRFCAYRGPCPLLREETGPFGMKDLSSERDPWFLSHPQRAVGVA